MLPEGWESRLVPVPTPAGTGLCLEPHDLLLSKYVAGREKDRDYVRSAARHSGHSGPPALLLLSECRIIRRMSEAATVGKRGTVVIPARLRRKLGIEEGATVLFEECPDGVVIRPAVTVPIEVWGPERRAAFLLENAVDRKDYAWARREVQRMGLDPDAIPHGKPRS